VTDRWRQVLARLDVVEPSPGLWERALARSAESLPPEDRAGRGGRILPAVMAVVVALGGLMAAFLALRGLGSGEPGSTGSVPPPAAPGQLTYRDPTGTWEITYPDRFVQGTIPSWSGLVSLEGIWVANLDSPAFHDKGGPLPREFPDDGVMVELYQVFGGPLGRPAGPDSKFPISVDDLEARGGMPNWRSMAVVANGEPYLIAVGIGPEASQGDREAAARIIESLRFLPVEEGTAIGRHLDFYVLGQPDDYPLWSVTRFDRSNLPRSDYGPPFPFYLVHVPEGFYALAWPDDLRDGYKDCDVSYHPETREFSCPTGARWSLDGSVIAKPGPRYQEDRLAVLMVRISLDGHVLVSPNVFMTSTQSDLELTGGN
jgi:hypothetical protein